MKEEFVEKFPEAIRDWDEFKNSETPEQLWDQVTNMRSKFGTALFKPGEDAGAEDWGKFSTKAVELSGGKLMPRPDLEDTEQLNALYASLGRPADKTGYEFENIEGANLDDARKQFIAEIAFDAGLTKTQLKTVEKKIREADFGAMQQALSAQQEELKGLRQEWGMAFDERNHAAKKIAATFFPHLPADIALSAPELKAFYSLSAQLGKGGSEFREQGDNHQVGVTPGEAAEKIAEIRNNKEHPYHDPRKPGHDVAKKKMRELYLIKNNLPPA